MHTAQSINGHPRGVASNGPDLAAVYQKRDSSPMQIPATDTMPSFNRLLVATDFSPASQAAFRTALDNCRALGASLVILHVCEYPAAGPPDTGGFLIEQQVLCEKCRNGLDELRQQAEQAGVTCEAILAYGVAASSILDFIEAKGIDLAVLGTNALHGFERLVFGSTAEAVLRKSPCPVLTVGPRVAQCAKACKADGPIIFATDFDFTTIHAIRYAARFSSLDAAPLHCLHVLPRTLEAGSQCEIVPSIMSEALQQVAAESGVVIDRKSVV